jgi:hypothetical protein
MAGLILIGRFSVTPVCVLPTFFPDSLGQEDPAGSLFACALLLSSRGTKLPHFQISLHLSPRLLWLSVRDTLLLNWPEILRILHSILVFLGNVAPP